MSLNEKIIIGNAKLVNFLSGLASTDKLPTALLLTGPVMVGKTTILENLAKHIVCDKGESCGICPGCVIGLDNHPDVLRQAPSEEESLRKGISTLLKRIYEKPVMAKKLIVFLENIDQFSWAAAPLLLKVLEDAPSFVTFFLTAENLESVLPTIRSRCLVRQVAPVSAVELKTQLRNQPATIDKNEKISSEIGSQIPRDDVDLIEQIVPLSGGRPGLAKRLLESADLREKYLLWHRTLEKMQTLTIGERSQFAETIEKADEGKDVLNLLQSLLRERAFNAPNEKTNQKEKLKNVLTTIRRSREALAMLKANIPQRLALEYVFFIN